jgi:leucine dehydrogenase
VGEPSEPTAVGVLAALRVVLKHLFGSGDAAGRHLTIIGLGQVGSRLARALSEQGATMAVTDIDPSKKELAGELGALWLEPEDALGTETDVLVPAALGGILTAATVDDLRCRAIAGPANNQLSEPQVAERLAARGILWAPDFLVNAGGAIYGTMVDIAQAEHEKTMDKVAAIGETLSRILDAAEREGTTTLAAASRLAENRIETARRAREERAPRSLASVHPRRN